MGKCSNIIPDSKLNYSSSMHIRVGYICDEAVFVKNLDEVIMPAAIKKASMLNMNEGGRYFPTLD